MESTDLATKFFGFAGTIASVIMVFIPIFMMYDMFKTKSTTRVTYLLFITTLLNNFFWFIYGFIVFSYPIIVTNAISGTFNMIYLICFIAYLDLSRTKKLLLISTMEVLIIIGLFIGLYFLNAWDKQLFGIVTIAVNFCVFIGPIQKIVQAFKERDSSYIPIEIVVALVVNSVIWIMYGVCLSNDFNIIIPNSFGLVLMVLECCVWCYYYYLPKEHKPNLRDKTTDRYNDFENETNDTEDQPLMI